MIEEDSFLSINSNKNEANINLDNPKIINEKKIKVEKEILSSNKKTKKPNNFPISKLIFLLIVCGISSFIYITLRADSRHSNNNKRELFTLQEYKELCIENQVYNFTSNIITSEDKFNMTDTFTEFIKNYQGDYNEDYESFLEAAVNGDTKKLVDLGRKIFIKDLVIMSFAVVTLILWLVFCICVSRPRYCCAFMNIDDEKNNNKCHNISLGLFFLGVFSSLVVSCLGFVFAEKYNKNVNKFECSLLKFYSDTKYGENNNSTRKWAGFFYVYNMISDMNKVYINIENEYKSIYKSVSSVNSGEESMKNEMKKLYNDYGESLVTNPNATSSTAQISPDFIKVSKLKFELKLFT